MDLELLRLRKAELEQARNNLTNSYQVITGHMQECDYMIDQLTKEAQVVSENKVEGPIESPEDTVVE